MTTLVETHGMSEGNPTVVPLTTIMENHQGCIFVATKPAVHTWMRPIFIRYHFVRDDMKNGTISVKYLLPTDEMVADTLTKCLAAHKFRQHRKVLLGLLE